MRYRFTVRARADLRDIAAYTRDRWGDAQCDLYLWIPGEWLKPRPDAA